MHPIITTNLSAIRELCKKHGIATLEVFGSILRDDFDVDSDVDVLVTFEHDTERTLRTFMQLEHDLRTIFHRDVDVIERSVIEQSENYIRRRSILSTAKQVYRAA